MQSGNLILTQGSQENDYDVIVVGGGMAGVAAANNVLKKGLRVLILEARDHIGGRCHTNYAYGVPIEMGAQWIHGHKHNPLMPIVKELDAKWIATTLKFDRYYMANGQPASQEYIEEIEDYESQFEKFLEKKRKKHPDHDQSLKEVWEEFRSEVAQQYRRPERVYLNSTYEQEYSGSLDDLSMLHFDSDSEFGGSDIVLTGGYDKLIYQLLGDILVHLNEPVISIDYTAEIVKIKTSKNIYSAKSVVVTLPLGVLKEKTVEFIPPLPTDKQASIDKLGFGLLNKVILSFPKLFWDEKAHWLEYHAEDDFYWTEYFSLYPYHKKPILVAFNAGDPAEKLEKKSDEETLASLMQVLRKIFGESIPDPEWYMITRWKKDEPYSKGSYSYIHTDSTDQDYAVLAKPIADRVYFAGEATNGEYFATVHGAFLSGVRAAKEVVAQLSHDQRKKDHHSHALTAINSLFSNHCRVEKNIANQQTQDDAKHGLNP